MSVVDNEMEYIHQDFVKESQRLLMAATSEAKAEIAIGNFYVRGCSLFVVMKQGGCTSVSSLLRMTMKTH